MDFIGIGIVTKNVLELTEFYKAILGVEAEGNDIHAELKTEGGSVAIFSDKGMEEMAPGSMKGAGTGNITINFKVKDVDAEYTKIKKIGVDVLMLPTTHPWGARSFWFRDPDGNIINFVSY